MIESPKLFIEVADRFGVPVAFAIIMVILLLYFTNQHRSERREWREMFEDESKMNRAALDKLRETLNALSISVALINGKRAKR